MSKLVEYEWDYDTGTGVFVYEDVDTKQLTVVARSQKNYWVPPKFRVPLQPSYPSRGGY